MGENESPERSNLLTGELCAGEPHARFGGRGGANQCPIPTPIRENTVFVLFTFFRGYCLFYCKPMSGFEHVKAPVFSNSHQAVLPEHVPKRAICVRRRVCPTSQYLLAISPSLLLLLLFHQRLFESFDLKTRRAG
jgi:hypothetical protein